MAKYRKKPVEVEAVKLEATDASIHEVVNFIEGEVVDTSSSLMLTDRFHDYCDMVKREGMKIKTLEGTMTADIGDYIIKGVQGEFYPCKPDIFKETYEKVE